MAQQEADVTVELAVHRWYRNCVGLAEEIDGSPLRYEPRSAWSCQHCHAVLIGTKSGDLYFALNGSVSKKYNLGDVSIQAVHVPDHPQRQRLLDTDFPLEGRRDVRIILEGIQRRHRLRA